MMLFKTIDGLFLGMKYGVWGLSLLGVIASAGLFFVNIGMGLGAMMVFIATLALSFSLGLLLLPNKLVQTQTRLIHTNRYVASGALAVIALVVMGVTYFTSGGFPELNLFFL